jgi:hypothetical protein
LLLLFGATALAGFREPPETRTPRTLDVIHPAAFVVKKKDIRIVNMSENSEGVGTVRGLLSLTRRGGADGTFSGMGMMSARRRKNHET